LKPAVYLDGELLVVLLIPVTTTGPH